jgi:hypothetical protein
LADLVAELGGVQASAEHFPVRGIEPGQMQVQPPYPVISDLHRGEMAVVGHRGGAQLRHGGLLAINLNMCHRPFPSSAPPA